MLALKIFVYGIFVCVFSGQDKFGDSGLQSGAAAEAQASQEVGSSCMIDEEELRIVSVHGGVGASLQGDSDILFSASELQALSSLSDHSIASENMLNFTSGANDRAPIRGMQDNGAELARSSQLERNYASQMGSTILNPALKPPIAGANSHGGLPGLMGQFPQQQSLLPHASNKSLDCSFCGERFHSREDLIVHRASHTGEPPIPCSCCGKSFVNKTTLNIHMRIHTGEKPYACAQCGKCFTQNGSLKIHLRTHSGEKPYRCNHCTASFNNPSNLRRHMITHSSNAVL